MNTLFVFFDLGPNCFFKIWQLAFDFWHFLFKLPPFRRKRKYPPPAPHLNISLTINQPSHHDKAARRLWVLLSQTAWLLAIDSRPGLKCQYHLFWVVSLGKGVGVGLARCAGNVFIDHSGWWAGGSVAACHNNWKHWLVRGAEMLDSQFMV